MSECQMSNNVNEVREHSSYLCSHARRVVSSLRRHTAQ